MFFKSVKFKKTNDDFETDDNFESEVNIEGKQEIITPFKQYKSKDSKNLFAKKMLLKRKQLKLNSKKKFSVHDWGIDNTNYVFIDFEIANSNKTSACQLIMIKVTQGKIVKTYSSLIKPHPEEFTFSHVHGITNESVSLMSNFKELWVDIVTFFTENTVVIAHHANFNINILRSLINHYDLECSNFFYICSVKLFRRTYDYPNNRLSALAHSNQIKFDHHDSLADVTTLHKLINIHFSEHYHLKTLCNNLNIKMGRLFDDSLS
ncbi:exonuclease domain-containing protein [Spiroplasma endosymbiont of Cleonymus obscurus]|uniref:exonuclease domain-containing protein n=1 Tax=Spiroplasma endosymbiont of Cleonymus obscurus TaxID=3066324 RepID=UPI0037DC4E7A